MIDESWVFIVGCQRCATTSLLKYFMLGEGVKVVRPIRPEQKPLLKKEWKDYILENGEAGKLNFDKATSYIEYPKVSEIISKNFSNYKILVSIRNPVYRAISNYHFSVENGIEDRSIEEAFFSKESRSYKDISVSPFDYIKRGFYRRYIESYLANIPEECMRVVVAENFMRDACYRNEISNWLGVEIKDETFPHVNSSLVKKVEVDFLKRLYAIYEEENYKLEKRFGLDLRYWYE
ncbi:MAG: hypothetical protein ACQEUK_03285 [Pseudomonadota bacterium]